MTKVDPNAGRYPLPRSEREPEKWTLITTWYFSFLFMHVKQVCGGENDTLGLVLRVDPNSVAQTIKQNCILWVHTRKLGARWGAPYTRRSKWTHQQIWWRWSTTWWYTVPRFGVHLLTHVNVIMSWFWKGRHFRNASDKAMCPVKLGFITSCCKQVKCIWYITHGSLWKTNKWKGWESTMTLF